MLLVLVVHSTPPGPSAWRCRSGWKLVVYEAEQQRSIVLQIGEWHTTKAWRPCSFGSFPRCPRSSCYCTVPRYEYCFIRPTGRYCTFEALLRLPFAWGCPILGFSPFVPQTAVSTLKWMKSYHIFDSSLSLDDRNDGRGSLMTLKDTSWQKSPHKPVRRTS